MKILLAILLSTLIFIPNSYSSSTLNMNVYCTSNSSRVSFPFPGQPERINSPEFEEAYIYKDVTNINSYQFYFKRISKSLNPKEYLDGVITGRIRSVKATLIDKKIYKSGNKTIANYSYRYSNDNSIKLSYVKAVIFKDIYCSWSVQSYEGSSDYSADYIFMNYSKYVDNDGGYCK